MQFLKSVLKLFISQLLIYYSAFLKHFTNYSSLITIIIKIIQQTHWWWLINLTTHILHNIVNHLSTDSWAIMAWQYIVKLN